VEGTTTINAVNVEDSELSDSEKKGIFIYL